MSSHERLSTEDQLILDAQRLVTTAAVYILFVGGVGFFVEPLSGFLVLLVGGAVLGGAWLIRTFQSRPVAATLLIGAVLLFAQRTRNPEGLTTGLVLMGFWLLGGAFSLYATLRYHRLAQNRGGA